MTTEIYKAWTPTYRDSKNASGAAAAGDSGGLRFQSGLQQLVVERVEETKMADLRVRLATPYVLKLQAPYNPGMHLRYSALQGAPFLDQPPPLASLVIRPFFDLSQYVKRMKKAIPRPAHTERRIWDTQITSIWPYFLGHFFLARSTGHSIFRLYRSDLQGPMLPP